VRGGSNKLLTPAQTAELLAVKERTLMDNYRRWNLQAVRVGRAVRFRERTIESWLDEQTITV
jgi:excisionase family DNA binding protein